MQDTVNLRVRKLRESKGYSQEETADLIGIKRSTYAYRESKGKFTEAELRKLAEKFDVPYDWLANIKIETKTPLIIPNDEKPLIFESPKLTFDAFGCYITAAITPREGEFLVALRGLTDEQFEEEFKRVVDLKNTNRAKNIKK